MQARDDRRHPPAIEPVIDRLTVTPAAHQPGGAQPREMLGDRRLLEADQALQFAHPMFALAQQAEQGEAPPVGQGLEGDYVEGFHGRIFAFANIRARKKDASPVKEKR